MPSLPHSSGATSIPRWLRRSLGDSRSTLLTHLRREPRTVDQLARSVGLTKNAVRSHLALLEQDGIVERLTLYRATPGKPAQAYRITPSAAVFLSSAYAPTTQHLLAAVEERLPPHELVALLRAVGRSLAAGHRSSSMRLRARIQDAAAALTEIGGDAAVAERGDVYSVTSEHCPLSALTAAHPAACHALGAFVGEIAGAPARHRCERGEHLRCRFEIAREEMISDASGHPGE